MELKRPEPTVEEILAEVERRRAARRAQEAQRRPFEGWILRAALSIVRHWLALLNSLVFLYVAVPFLAPVLMETGHPGSARLIYLAYRPLCHQIPYRSWFLFGERPFYSMEELLRRGIPPELLEPFGYVGDESLGYKVALCQRDTALYGSIFLAGLAFAFGGRRWRPLSLRAYLLFGVLPILLDGGIQWVTFAAHLLFPAWGIPVLESTPLRRVITGALMGSLTVWAVYPRIHQALQESFPEEVRRTQV
ncbi:MAG: DUF2085 domain-containing protein [Anaerolineae bacterium]|nr:DUF2085 domain-containing protein [Anaerolineae bacterium]MCX8067243.1 DUF2085 domain-containing protein [Anaerolineae bacterium]MDW7992254.1 DUF2085 domain-containing protein [Anaerolineae bacterium]